MKIGITTYFNIKNYGSALQAFALRTFLIQQGHTAIFLNIKEQRLWENLFHKIHVAAVIGTKCIVSRKARETQKEIDHLKKVSTAVISKETLKAFSRFEEEYLPSLCVGRRKLKRLAASNEYGAFICGSDQIWSPLSPHLSGFKFLSFAPRNKRIAYAPSFGVSKIPAYNTAFVRKKLLDIDDISVREFDGAKIVKELTGRDVPVLLDPTMLLSGEQWRRIYQENVLHAQPDKYILCYFFDEPNKRVVSKINEFANLKKLKIKVLFSSNKTFIENGAEFVSAGPLEFLQLVDKAQYVFTNSFHGCVFSVLFDKRFVAFGRNHSETVKQASRIKTLLEQVGSQQCFYEEDQIDFLFPNVDSFENAIKPFRNMSSEYLINCLKKDRE